MQPDLRLKKQRFVIPVSIMSRNITFYLVRVLMPLASEIKIINRSNRDNRAKKCLINSEGRFIAFAKNLAVKRWVGLTINSIKCLLGQEQPLYQMIIEQVLHNIF